VSTWLSAFPKAITKKPLTPLLAVVFGLAAFFASRAELPVILSAILWGVFFYFLVAFF
jgi:uncharacterized membrane protein